jgi:hypothetical protein
MIVKDLKYYTNLDFNEYLQISGYSFSGIKMLESGKPILTSEGMKLGTRVHNFLLEPDKYDGEDYFLVFKIAAELRKWIKDAFQFLEPEVAFTARFEHNGMYLDYKGRADLIFKGKIIIDLKVLAGRIKPALERFGYDKQLSGYSLATGCSTALILAYNKTIAPNKINEQYVEHFNVPISHEWWNYMIVKYGKPI